MKQNPKRVTKVFINLIKLSTMRTLKLIVMAIMTLVVGCQKFEQNNTDNPKDPTEQQGSGTNNGNKTDKNDKSKDESKPKPPTFATGVVRLSPEDYAKIPKAKFPATGDENLPDEFMLDYPKNNIPSQQALGSCVAFSLCSALYVKLMHERMHIPYEDRSRYPSAAFVYN